MGQIKNEQRQRVNWLLRQLRESDPARITEIFAEAAFQFKIDSTFDACVLDYLEAAAARSLPAL